LEGLARSTTACAFFTFGFDSLEKKRGQKMGKLESSNSLVYFLATHLRQSRGGFGYCGSIGSITVQLYFSAAVSLHWPLVYHET
jgi:hypothetical protein